MLSNTTIVYPLPLDMPERLAKWDRWAASFAGIDFCEPDWMKAASRFFSRFATERAAMHRHSGDWEVVDMKEQTARVSPPHQVEDLVWQFIERAPGKYGIRLVGTVSV